MWPPRRNVADRLTALTSDIAARLQRLEKAHLDLRAKLEGEHQLRVFTANLMTVGQAAPAIGTAIEHFARAMRTPQPRGRAGGLARARQAAALEERWPNGRYMSHWDYEEIERQIANRLYMRNAAGGFARVATATRAANGTFLPST